MAAPWLLFLIISMLFALVLTICVVLWVSLSIVTVENDSMSPALEHGDRVLVWRLWSAKWLRKGQIVIVWPGSDAPPPGTELDHIPSIKRVIGLPRDRLVTYITELPEHLRQYQLYDKEGKRTWYIPPERFFVRSDQPIGGHDSLTWGPIPFHNLLGIVILKLPRRPYPYVTVRSDLAHRTFHKER
jgi:signal peptidase I